MDLIEQFYPILIYLISGLGYGAIWWTTQYFDPTKPTTQFQLQNLAITLVYAVAFAVLMYVIGNPMSQESIFIQLGASAAAIAGAQRVLQTLYRAYKENHKAPPG